MQITIEGDVYVNLADIHKKYGIPKQTIIRNKHLYKNKRKIGGLWLFVEAEVIAALISPKIEN
jgi:hypothetical protein